MAWIVIAVLVWLVVGGTVALVIGHMIRSADHRAEKEADAVIRQAPVTEAARPVVPAPSRGCTGRRPVPHGRRATPTRRPALHSYTQVPHRR